ncbi:MAG: archease [Candidatus Obscuribacterales bacterium]|nr:archease [Candidatus Obscuribacterales bacterium]
MLENEVEGFEILDHPADMGFRCRAKTMEVLFERCARGLTSLLVDLGSIECQIEREFDYQGDELDLVLYNWLSEILFLFDAEGLLFSKFVVKNILTTGESLTKFEATLYGQNFDRTKHEVKTYVKAITLHQLKVERKAGEIEAQVFLDI